MSMTWVGHRSDEATARALLADPEPADELFEAASESSVDLEKAWHGLHWMLAQGGSPFDEAIRIQDEERTGRKRGDVVVARDAGDRGQGWTAGSFEEFGPTCW